MLEVGNSPCCNPSNGRSYIAEADQAGVDLVEAVHKAVELACNLSRSRNID